MKFSAQSSYLYNCERRTVVCKVYRALSCLYPHAFLPQSVQQIVSLVCHITLYLMFSIFLLPTQQNCFRHRD